MRASAPPRLAAIEAETQALGFGMGSDAATGALLRALAASKPGGALLELGTGTGLATCWLLAGMDDRASLLSVDSDERVAAVARRHLGSDARVRFLVSDGGGVLEQLAGEGRRFDLVFADAWPGKFSHLDDALKLLAPGGLYVVDDLLPQPNWPPGHQDRVDALLEDLWHRPGLVLARLDWSTGIAVAASRASS